MTTASTTPPSARLRAATPAILLAIVAACSPAAQSPSPGASGTPGGSPGTTAGPTATPAPTTIAGIQHPTGAADVVLRIESGGGLVMAGASATDTPLFTLYGDGRVVWRDPNAPIPDPIGAVTVLAPLRTVRLSEQAVQSLLEDAIGRGGLGDAAETYMGQGADLPTTTFTLNANGATKTVSATPLSPDMQPQAGPIISALAALAERLQGFSAVVGDSDPYAPTAYRGVLMPQDQAFNPPVAWPWTTIAPADFRSQGNDFVLVRTLTPDDVAAFGFKEVEGGFMGLTLETAGKVYGFSLRPLLPDETE